jgi:hypothetical protein
LTTLTAAPTSIEPTSEPVQSAPRSRTDLGALVGFILLFAALSLAASITSDGFLEADGCTHYLYARFAFDEPHYFVNIWGRPICTALYAVPASLAGRFGVRTTSLLVAIAVALIAYAIARRQGYRRPALALIFTLSQPLVFLHSFSELTELPFALLLGLAFLAYQGRRWMYLAILVSILPLSRPEGFGFIALAAIALVAHRRWVWLFLLPLPVMVWSYAGWSLYGHQPYPWWQWLARNWPYAEKSSYEAGSLFHFAMLLPAVVSPLVFPAMWLGVWRCLDKPDFREHRARCQVLIAAIPLMILVGHSVLYATGRMASSGELRYMLVAAPFWALLAAKGWEWLFERRRWCREMQFAMLAAIVPIFVNRIYQVLPLAYTEDWVEARVTKEWIEQTPLGHNYPRIATSHPGLFFFLDMSPTAGYRVVEWRKDNIARPPKGVILVWDWVYGTHNSDDQRVITVEDLLRAGWVQIGVPRVQDTRPAPNTRLVFLSPFDVTGKPTAGASTTRGFPSRP